MVKLLNSLAAAGLATAALAVAGPVTAHAQANCSPNGCGPCFFSSPGHPVQHVDYGTGNKHGFTDSHDNCVIYYGNNNTTLLNGSDGNLFLMFGNNNKVDDFRHSDNNFVVFENGASGNNLQASNADGNFVLFTNSATNDFVDLLGATNDDIYVSGTGLFANVVGSNGSCSVNPITAAGGTRAHPALVIC
jgi:hypothetical protein